MTSKNASIIKRPFQLHSAFSDFTGTRLKTAVRDHRMPRSFLVKKRGAITSSKETLTQDQSHIELRLEEGKVTINVALLRINLRTMNLGFA